MNANQSWEKPKTFTKGTPEWDAEMRRLLADWEAKKETLRVETEKLKTAEMDARKAFAAFTLDGIDHGGKTQRVELDNGFYASVKQPIKYNFRKGNDGKIDKNAINEALDRIEAAHGDGAGKLIAERLVNWNPALALSEYNLLCEEDKAIIDEVIEVKEDGVPTLDIKGGKK